MRGSKLKRRLIRIDIIFDLLFLYAGTRYYILMGERCDAFKTPPQGLGPQFPDETSNEILAKDCTTGSGDTAIMMFKMIVFTLKTVSKMILLACSKKDNRIPFEDHTLEYLMEKNDKQENDIIIWTKYPSGIYQALLVINALLFPALLIFSWIPRFKEFSTSVKGCPDFLDTGLNAFMPNNLIQENECNLEAYKWQKFSWADQFFYMIITTFITNQIFKICYNFYQLSDSLKKFLSSDVFLNLLSDCLKKLLSSDVFLNLQDRLSSMIPPSLFTKVKLFALTTMFFEAIFSSSVLLLSCSKFPGGVNALIKNSFGIAMEKIDHSGETTPEFIDYMVQLTQIDQQLFYSLPLIQLFVIVPSFLLSYLIYYRDERIKSKLFQQVGSYLRILLEILSIAIPLITTLLFFISASKVHTYDECYFDNFSNSLYHLFHFSREKILPGKNGACNLSSITSYQSSPILQAAVMGECILSLFIAIPSLLFIFALHLALLLPEKIKNHRVFRKLLGRHHALFLDPSRASERSDSRDYLSQSPQCSP